jgi:hypothetical protein
MSTHHHSRWGRPLALSLILALLAGRPALAQAPPGSSLPSPRLFVLTPPGGKAGSTVEVAFTGIDLEEPQALLFSHPGIKAEPIQPPPPPPPDPKKPKPAPMPPPAVARFKVTIPADTPLGIHDARLVNKWGISNPRAFVVGDLAEVLEKEPNNDVPEAQRIDLNSTVNGTIAAPTDVDYYVFAGKKGQRVVVSCPAASIDSRAHPAVEVYDARGRLLASGRNYRLTDALTDCTLPDDGDFFVRVFQFTHTQGSPEHFYRLSVSTAPWIDAIHPCVLEPGKATTVTVYGRNLPGGKLDPASLEGDRALEKIAATISVSSDPESLQRLNYRGHVAPSGAGLDGFEYRLRNDSGTSNPFLLTVARAPVALDNEANDTPETAQEIALPCEIAGRVEKRRDRDWYAFTAKKGEVWNIEVISDRLGAPTYPYFFVRAAGAKDELKESEDNQDTLSRKFYTRTEDPPVFRFTAPADGKYQLLVGSRLADSIAGPRHFYRVRIAPEQPDFRLVVMAPESSRPEAPTLRQGGNESFTVFALRQDGFAGEVALSVEGLPAGVTCVPQVLGGDVREVQLVVNAAPAAAAWTGEVKVKGTATIKGQKVVREARPASIVWPVQPQQNLPTISRLDRGLFLAVRDQAPYSAKAALDKPAIVQGDKGTLKVTLTRLWPDLKVPLTVQALAPELPRGLTINNNQPSTIAPTATEGSLPVVVAANVQPGVYTLVLSARAGIPYNKDPKAKNKQPVLVTQPTAPVTLTVLPKELAKLSLSNQGPAVKQGMQTEVLVKVQRLFNYAGEFKVQVVLPPNAKGVTVADVVIPAGKDEAPLVIKAAKDAPVANLANLTVRASGSAFGTVVNHELKFNVNVVK